MEIEEEARPSRVEEEGRPEDSKEVERAVEEGRTMVEAVAVAKEEPGEDSLLLLKEEEVSTLLLSFPRSSTRRSSYSHPHLPNSPSWAPRS